MSYPPPPPLCSSAPFLQHTLLKRSTVFTHQSLILSSTHSNQPVISTIPLRLLSSGSPYGPTQQSLLRPHRYPLSISHGRQCLVFEQSSSGFQDIILSWYYYVPNGHPSSVSPLGFFSTSGPLKGGSWGSALSPLSPAHTHSPGDLSQPPGFDHPHMHISMNSKAMAPSACSKLPLAYSKGVTHKPPDVLPPQFCSSPAHSPSRPIQMPRNLFWPFSFSHSPHPSANPNSSTFNSTAVFVRPSHSLLHHKHTLPPDNLGTTRPPAPRTDLSQGHQDNTF